MTIKLDRIFRAADITDLGFIRRGEWAISVYRYREWDTRTQEMLVNRVSEGGVRMRVTDASLPFLEGRWYEGRIDAHS